MKLKGYQIVPVVALSVLAFTAAAPANASPLTQISAKPPSSDAAALWANLDLPSETRSALTALISSGTILDSEKAGAVPASTSTWVQEGYNYSLERFADSSFRLTALETPAAGGAFPVLLRGTSAERQYSAALLSTGMSAQAASVEIKPCMSTSSGTGYFNAYDCRVFGATSVVEMSFYASYSLVAGQWNDTIIGSPDSPYVYAWPGTAATPILKVVKRTETSSGAARVTATTTFKAANGSSSTTYTLNLYVGSNKAWAAWS